MLTRNKTRIALVELQQIQPATAFVKPLQSLDADCASLEGLAIVAKRMNVISLDSSSDEQDVPRAETNVIDLSQLSKDVMEISSSDEDNADDSLSSDDEDEDVDQEESEHSEDDNHSTENSSSSTFASKVQAAEVAKLISGGDPKKLKVDDCRAYLRNYGLRISGTKPVLIDRIKQHIELQEGGSRNYDRSTFTINCTGDVCKGDVVIFDQKVYNKSSVSAVQTGSRTVAGRVVKESYGAQRQQHTFTVEVLWSTGCQPLAPMKQLLVKGRNLYKRRTFRQKWADEREREKSLAEKHKRGDAARHVRALKQGRLRGYGATFGAEGPSIKQLANPYTNTLACKENISFASGTVFQSAVSSDHTAAVRTRQHSVHNHTSYVSTGANTTPLGKNRQFGRHSENVDIKLGHPLKSTGANTVPLGKIRQVEQHSENVDINLDSVPAPKSTGANNVPLGKFRQFGQNSENGKIDVSSRGVSKSTDAVPLGGMPQTGQATENGEFYGAAEAASASVAKHRQWFKPTDVLLPSGQGCEAPMVAAASREGNSRMEPGSFDSREFVSVQAPIISKTYQGARSRDTRTQRQDGRVSSLPNRHSSPLLTRPKSPFPNRPSSPYHSRPSAPYHNRPSSPYQGRPSPYQGRPSSPYQSRPSSYQSRPSSPYQPRPSFQDHSRPSSPYHAGPSLLHQSRPSSPYQSRPSSPYQGRPSSPYHGRPSSPYHGRPSSTFHNQPASYGIRPSSPCLNRSASPLPSRFSSSNTGRPLSPTSVSVSQESRSPVSSNDVPKTGFLCPTLSCIYRGSRLCSSGLCYYCCKTKGGACRNPNHRPYAQ